MKRLLILLTFCVFTPSLLWGDGQLKLTDEQRVLIKELFENAGANADSCHHKSGFTIDKRCYVTNIQKTQQPYNATVALVEDSGFHYCTGTIVQKDDGKLYLYTAKHCICNDQGMAEDTIQIETQDGKKIDITAVGKQRDHGLYDCSNDANFTDDWASYEIPKEYYNDVSFRGINPDSAKNVRVIGYGSLKIMSDSEIQEFRQWYMSFLENEKDIVNNSKTEQDYARQGIVVNNGYGADFLGYLRDKDKEYYDSIFHDNDRLKVSQAKTISKSQVWGGNSGGGAFDDNDNLVGIITRAYRIIGGREHAGGSFGVSISNIR